MYGDVGCGKTHLMNAIANDVLKTYSGETFTVAPCHTIIEDYLQAVKAGNMEIFVSKYQQIRHLFLDEHSVPRRKN